MRKKQSGGPDRHNNHSDGRFGHKTDHRTEPHQSDQRLKESGRDEHDRGLPSHHEHHHNEYRRRERHHGRFFDHGELRLLLLALIAEQPRHGYELIKLIAQRLGGAYSPSPGTIYPALSLLEEQGYVRATASEGSRRLFIMTETGGTYLATNQAQVELILARMAEMRARRPDAPAPVVRAMENLKFAMRLRLERGPLSDPEAQAIAEALDAAAIAIERS